MDTTLVVGVIGLAATVVVGISVFRMGRKVMGQLEDLDVLFGEIANTTKEIAQDVTDMVGLIGTAPTQAQWDAFRTKVLAHAETLKGIAAQYPPVVPAAQALARRR